MKKKFLYFVLTLIITSIFAFSLNDSKTVLAVETFNKNNNYDLLTKETSSLILSSENLTFNVNVDDKIVYDNVSDYKNNVKIDYSIYNDTDTNVETTFYQCMRKPSDIEFKYFDENKKDFVYLDDKELYSIPFLGTYRYVYDLNKANNNLVSSIKDTYISSDFVNNESTIYKYTFKVETLNVKYVTYDYKDTDMSNAYKQFFGYNSSSFSNKNYTYYFNVLEDNTFIVYFINDLSDSFLNSCKAYNNNSSFLNSISVLKKETQKFEDFVFSYYDEQKDVSRVDYNNAIYDKINEKHGIYNDVSFFNIYDSLVRFYEFDINISKNKTATFSIVRPIYLQINKYYSPSLVLSYSFNFTNLSFKEIKSRGVKLKTDSFIINSSLEEISEKINSEEFLEIDPLNDFFSFSISNDPNAVNDLILGFDRLLATAIFFAIFLVGIMPIVLIGMIVALIATCSKGRRKFINLESNLKKLKTIYIIEGVFEIVLFTFCCWQFYINVFRYLQILLSIIIFIFTLIQIIKYNQKHIAKLVFSIILLILTILDAFFMELCIITSVIVLALFVINLVCIDKYKKKYCDQNETKVKKDDVKVKYYPLNILNNKDNIIVKIGLFIAIILILLFAFILKLNEILAVLLILLLYYLLHLIIQIHNLKDFTQFSKDLDYEKLKINILRKINDKRINPETVASYKLKLAEAALCYSLEDFKEFYDSIVNTNNDKIKRNSDLLQLNYLLNEKDFINKANELKNKYSKFSKKIDKFSERWKFAYTSIKDDKMLQKLPYNTKNNLSNAIDLFILINYYRNNNEIEKSNELYAIFKEKYSNVTLLNDILNGIDVRLRYKELINNEKINCSCCNAVIDKFLLNCPYCGSKINKNL